MVEGKGVHGELFPSIHQDTFKSIFGLRTPESSITEPYHTAFCSFAIPTFAIPLASCYPFLKGFLKYSFFGYCKDSVEDILCGFLYEHILENFLSGLIDILKRTGLLPKNGLVLVVNIVSHKTSLKFLFGLPAKKFKIESGSPVSRCIAPHGTQCVGQPHYLPVLSSPLPPHPMYSQFHESFIGYGVFINSL